MKISAHHLDHELYAMSASAAAAASAANRGGLVPRRVVEPLVFQGVFQQPDVEMEVNSRVWVPTRDDTVPGGCVFTLGRVIHSVDRGGRVAFVRFNVRVRGEPELFVRCYAVPYYYLLTAVKSDRSEGTPIRVYIELDSMDALRALDSPRPLVQAVLDKIPASYNQQDTYDTVCGAMPLVIQVSKETDLEQEGRTWDGRFYQNAPRDDPTIARFVQGYKIQLGLQ